MKRVVQLTSQLRSAAACPPLPFIGSASSASASASLVLRFDQTSTAPSVYQKLLLDAVNKYHIEYGSLHFSNHLTHAIVALAKLGANDDRLADFKVKYSKRLEPAIPSSSAIDEKNWRQFVGKQSHFADYVEYFSKCNDGNAIATVRAFAPSLLEGLSGRALHGLNQLGYAIESRHDALLPNGLSYLAFGYRSLGTIEADKIPADATGAPLTISSVFEAIDKLRTDSRFDRFQRPHGTAFDSHVTQLTGNKEFISLISEYDLPLDSCTPPMQQMRLLLKAAITLFTLTGARDFFLLHGITSSRSLKQVLRIYDGVDEKQTFQVESPSSSTGTKALLTAPQVQRLGLAYHYRALLVTYFSQGRLPIDSRIESMVDHKPWPAIVERGIADDDEHLIKLAFVARAEQIEEMDELLAAGVALPVPDAIYSFAAHYGLEQVNAQGWIF